MTKVEESVREKRIKKWKDEGNLSDRAVPVFPSAQLFYSLNKKELTELQKTVEDAGEDWDDYEAEMKEHHPIVKGVKVRRGVVCQR